MFELLCEEACFVDACSSETERMRLKKRLSRGRKFELLVQVFGQSILDFVPEISVSRMDGIRLEDLAKLQAGSIEAKRVQRIMAKIRGP